MSRFLGRGIRIGLAAFVGVTGVAMPQAAGELPLASDALAATVRDAIQRRVADVRSIGFRSRMDNAPADAAAAGGELPTDVLVCIGRLDAVAVESTFFHEVGPDARVAKRAVTRVDAHGTTTWQPHRRVLRRQASRRLPISIRMEPFLMLLGIWPAVEVAGGPKIIGVPAALDRSGVFATEATWRTMPGGDVLATSADGVHSLRLSHDRGWAIAERTVHQPGRTARLTAKRWTCVGDMWLPAEVDCISYDADGNVDFDASVVVDDITINRESTSMLPQNYPPGTIEFDDGTAAGGRQRTPGGVDLLDAVVADLAASRGAPRPSGGLLLWGGGLGALVLLLVAHRWWGR